MRDESSKINPDDGHAESAKILYTYNVLLFNLLMHRNLLTADYKRIHRRGIYTTKLNIGYLHQY